MEYLKIKCWSAVIGGSLGGMQAMHWAVSHSSRLKSAVIIAASLKLSAQNIAFNEVARRAIMSDPDFHNGAYLDHDVTPKQGLALARMIGHLTYLSDSALGRKFGRLVRNGDLDAAEKALVEFEISSYLNYQGDKFADNFDANSYILITKMLDYFDLAHSFNDEAVDAFSKSNCNFLVVSFSSDWRFSPQCSKEITDALIEADKNVSYLQIDSDQGHDAFLLPNSRYEDGLRAFLFATSNHLNGAAT
jgi:homoserine O-acetyltransferase